MKTRQSIDAHAQSIDPTVRTSVYAASKIKYDKRLGAMTARFRNPDDLRHTAGQIKQHTLDHLGEYLQKATDQLRRNGAQVHFANDAAEANHAVLSILRAAGASRIIKSKSMVSEEIHLNAFLEANGCESVESDLGEFIVQLDGDTPSHIVTPIIHKNRAQVAATFEKCGLGDYNDDPQVITARARTFMRRKFVEAQVGVTGANFISAESGRIVLATNEGNARFTVAANRIQIVLVGIEKLVPRDRDLALMLNLLARSATAQALTVYTQFITGPRAPSQPDGPDALHVIFLDNGRSAILESEFREILRCIRCGACLNVCPVYRQSGGHAYRAVYPGPVGAVLSPLLANNDYASLSDLPKASSLCGACNEVCPVNIPLPKLLLLHRDKSKREGHAPAATGSPPLVAWSHLCSQPLLWKTALATGSVIDIIPPSWVPVPAFQSWTQARKLPSFDGGTFRKWFKNRPTCIDR